MGETIPNHLLFFTEGPTVAIVELRVDLERERPLCNLLPELERERDRERDREGEREVLSGPFT